MGNIEKSHVICRGKKRREEILSEISIIEIQKTELIDVIYTNKIYRAFIQETPEVELTAFSIIIIAGRLCLFWSQRICFQTLSFLTWQL